MSFLFFMMNEIVALNENGIRLFEQGKLDEALVVFETAVSPPNIADQPALAAELHNNIGVIHKFRGNYAKAHQAFDTASTLFQQQQMRREYGMTLGNLGDLLAKQKKRKEAAAQYAAAISILESVGAKAEQSQLLRASSLLNLRRGQWWLAIDQMEASLTVKPRRGIGDWLFLFLLRIALRLFRGG